MGQPTTYSFKDVVAAFYHPLTGPFPFEGEIGVGAITITMETNRTAHAVAADGALMISYIPGDNARARIEAQQTSPIHHFLVSWYNLVKAAADNYDVSQWATATLGVFCPNDGTTHSLQYISPEKIPDKPYQTQGQNVTWELMVGKAEVFAA